jgi:hypothetical protein
VGPELPNIGHFHQSLALQPHMCMKNKCINDVQQVFLAITISYKFHDSGIDVLTQEWDQTWCIVYICYYRVYIDVTSSADLLI